MMAAYSISVANRQRALRIGGAGIKRLARSVLAREQVASAQLSVAIVDDRQIHAVNRRYLQHDFPTDVISFLFEERGEPNGRIRRGAGKKLDGEIIISAETALRNARDHETSWQQELALYLVHGLLHLCGYDDTTPREKRLMRRREAEAMNEWAGAEKRARRQGETKKRKGEKSKTVKAGKKSETSKE
ncbi:MAG TPA: rRNA maturation RNase YbeY [Planctomycetaceae bacterium]|nr:rRNA maturation RNase YbeY [Planctomycetaceae bacterium]